MISFLSPERRNGFLLLKSLTAMYLFALLCFISPVSFGQVKCPRVHQLYPGNVLVKNLGRGHFQLRTIFLDQAENVMTLIREQLHELGYKDSVILSRHIDYERLENVLATGTDRDSKSTVWHWVHNTDASEASQKQNGITAAEITYMSTLDISKKPALSVPLAKGSWHDSVDYERTYDQLTLYQSYLASSKNKTLADAQEFWQKYVILVYRPDSTIFERAAEFEYWIRGDARKALLFAIVVGQDKESWRQKLHREMEEFRRQRSVNQK